MNHILITLCSAFLVIVVILPLVRLKLRTGNFGIVVRENSSGVETIVRLSTSFMFLGLVALSVQVFNSGIENMQPFIDPEIFWVYGAALSVVGMLIIIIAQAQMGASWRIGIDNEATELCTDGLYRLVRHPIYLGIYLCLIGVTLVAPTAWTLVVVTPGFLLVALQALLEEKHMFNQHGDDFLKWAKNTGRILPGIGTLKDEEEAKTKLGC